MPVCRYAVKPSKQFLRTTHISAQYHISRLSIRGFSTTVPSYDEVSLQSTSTGPPLDPTLVSTRAEERQLLRSGIKPIGSRRRRAALQGSANIPFEQLPYQCFQEARKILQADREEKLRQIDVQRARIARLQAQENGISGGEAEKKRQLKSMQKYLAELKILADINDPVIKKRFEDGQGDLDRPIYRYLADKQWRAYRRPLLVQRIMQMNVVPDVLPHLEPIADVRLAFGRRNVQPGEFVDSRVSEIPAKLKVQVFDKGERKVSIVVIDSDVPDPDKDGFDYRCQYLATNINLSPTLDSLPLSKLPEGSHVALPWLPPLAQKGSPYHRISVFVLQQPEGKEINLNKEKQARDAFSLRSFVDKHSLKPVGVHMFRSQWDEGTAGVMKRAGVEGVDIQFRRKKVEPLPYKKKDGARYR
ncbi:MAG: hypothetical protein M1835_004526 [Candelina submexicana]|nr:MAG: hypothetical protein M1835_004526 [Candelina submexicana]